MILRDHSPVAQRNSTPVIDEPEDETVQKFVKPVFSSLLTFVQAATVNVFLSGTAIIDI